MNSSVGSPFITATTRPVDMSCSAVGSSSAETGYVTKRETEKFSTLPLAPSALRAPAEKPISPSAIATVSGNSITKQSPRLPSIRRSLRRASSAPAGAKPSEAKYSDTEPGILSV